MKHFLRQNGLLLLIIALLLSVLIGIVSAVMGATPTSLQRGGLHHHPHPQWGERVLDWADGVRAMSFIMRRWSSRSRTWSAGR